MVSSFLNYFKRPHVSNNNKQQQQQQQQKEQQQKYKEYTKEVEGSICEQIMTTSSAVLRQQVSNQALLLLVLTCSLFNAHHSLVYAQQYQQSPVAINQQLTSSFSTRQSPVYRRQVRQLSAGPPVQVPAVPVPVLVSVPGKPAGNQAVQHALVLPYDDYQYMVNMTEQNYSPAFNLIENKRYVETATSRCFASTIMDDPMAFEPAFVIIRRGSEVRLNGTAPPAAILAANYDPRQKTTIFVHGFTQSYPNTTWLRRMRALFEMNSVVHHQNLVIMDWGRGAQGSYAQVAAKVSAMSDFLANFIEKLIELGTNRMNIHIIGHSLGAHLAGFAGKRTRPRIGRITALDPAGPCFGKIFFNGPNDRLAADDAYEVDVYHYDDDFLGLPGQHGQFDVYVNGGSKQPGCSPNLNAMFQALVTMVFRRNRVLSESHTRSTEVSSMQLSSTGCQQVAYECRDYNSFILGECGKCDDLNNQCFLMGFSFQYTDVPESPLRTSFPGKRLYISTGPHELYCLHHYQVLIRFEPSPELQAANKRNKWRLYLELLGDKQQAQQQQQLNLTATNQLYPNVFSALLLHDGPPLRFVAARLQARAADGSHVSLEAINNQLPKASNVFGVTAIEVNFMSNVNPNIRRALSSRLCPTGWLWPDSSGNSIADSSLQKEEGWLQLLECLPPGRP